MQALILAGGLGTRLWPIVSGQPKALAPVAQKPFLEYQIALLRAHRVNRIILCTGYLHEQIERYFKDGSPWGVTISYSVEETPLGTAGALKKAQPLLDGTFLVLNGDTYLDCRLNELIDTHTATRSRYPHCLATLTLAVANHSTHYGSVTIDQERRVLSFDEKAQARSSPGFVSAGVYVFEPKLLQFIAEASNVSLEREVFPSLLRRESRLFGYPTDGFFIDIGTPDGYRTFCNFVEDSKERGE